MKKVFSIFLFLVLLFTALSSCFAEDFTIHSGVKFGDTTNDILSKENLSLVNTTDTMVFYNGTVAGINNVNVVYFLDDNGKVKEATYEFPSSSSIGFSDVLVEYNGLLSALTEKYGTPLDKNDNICLVYGNTLTEHFSSLDSFASLNLSVESTLETASWSIPLSDNYVKVDVVYMAMDYKSSSLGKKAYCMIDYYIYTDNDVELAVENKKINLDDL